MSLSRLTRTVLVVSVALLAFAALEVSGVAQCAMCRASLAGSNNAYFIRNFNIGVLVLLTPPVAIFCSIFVILKRGAREDAQHEQDGPE